MLDYALSMSPASEIRLCWTEVPELTELIRRGQSGDRNAENLFFTIAYPFLIRVASRFVNGQLVRELLPADLVHDTYTERLRRLQNRFQDRNHYLAVATIAIRDQVIDRARKAKALKRCGGVAVTHFPQALVSEMSLEDVVTLDRLIEELRMADPQAAAVVRLRYYAGCSCEETAASVGATVKIVRTDWEFAQEWLKERLSKQ